MDAINYFDAHAYFQELASQNKLAKEHGFFPCSCSGINALEDVLNNFRRVANFVVVDDTVDASITNRNGAWYQKRVFTVFILARYELLNMTDQQQKRELCRQIFRQFHSRMIVDKMKSDGDIAYLDVENVSCREFSEYFISGCAGLYFMLSSYEPVNLMFNPDEWQP